MMYFNSQPHKEADDEKFTLDERCPNFNSQPHKEADGNGGAEQTD